MRFRDLIIPILLVSSLFSGLGGVGTQAIWVFPGMYYAWGNVNFSVSPVGGIDFSVVAVNASYVQFNDIKMNITPLPSTDTVDVYINDICPDTSVTGSGDLIIDYTSISGTIGASYNLSGLKVSHTYRYNVDGGGFTSINSNSSGSIFFSYGTGVHDFLVYDYGAGAGTVPVVLTNTSTSVEETSAVLNGYLVDDGGEDCTVGFEYGLTTGYGNIITMDADEWNSYSTIISGLVDVGYASTPCVFNMGGTWYMIAGANSGVFYGYQWSGVAWVSDAGITVGLVDIGTDSIPCVFNMGGTWYMIAGEYDGIFNGYQWSGVAWVSDAGITVGLVDVGLESTPFVFNMGGTWYMIAGAYSGVFYGYQWSGVAWVSDAGITVGLVDIGSSSAPCVFNMSGTWYMIAGENYGVFYGWYWPVFSYNVIGLSPGTLYHYRAFANNSNGTGYGSDMMFLTKPMEPTGLTVGTIHNTSIALSWTKGSGANNTMIRQSTTGYPASITDGDLVYNGTLSACTNTSLTPGVVYYYSAWSYTVWSGLYKWSDAGDTVSELTRPNPPTNTNIGLSISGNANLTWTKGTGANNTVILYKATGIPSSVTDGTVIYNGTGTYKVTPIVNGSVYYYKGWSYDVWGVFHHYSDNGTGFINTTGGGFIINCYDETNHSNLTFNVLVTNGTFTYEKTGCTNPESINASLCPHGEDVNIFISSSGHHSRSYIIDLFPGIIYVLNAYLPHNVSGGGDDASVLYNIQVVESYDTEYSHNDIPVQDVLVSVYRYINSTHQYKIITSALTDANGFISVYLIPGTYLYVTCNKTGYNTSSSFWTPSPPNAFGQTDVKVFRIVRPGSGGVIPPIGPIETLFTGIVWSIMPHTYYYNDSFNVYFNISSSLGQINWYRGALYYHNTTNTPYTWDLLFFTNSSTSTGGSISFTVPDINGTYAFSCAFDKDNFSYYTFSPRYYFVSGNPLESKVSGIPDMVWFVITIFIMIAAIAFLVKFGAGAMSGMGGLGVMAFMFALKPDMVIGNPPVSVWFIFLGTAITYLFVLFISRGKT